MNPTLTPITVITGRTALGRAWRLENGSTVQSLAPGGDDVVLRKDLQHLGTGDPEDEVKW